MYIQVRKNRKEKQKLRLTLLNLLLYWKSFKHNRILSNKIYKHQGMYGFKN